MKRDVKWMLLGIFLAVAAVWCLVLAGGSIVYIVMGYYVLPILAVITFFIGFGGAGNPPTSSQKENTTVPSDSENKE